MCCEEIYPNKNLRMISLIFPEIVNYTTIFKMNKVLKKLKIDSDEKINIIDFALKWKKVIINNINCIYFGLEKNEFTKNLLFYEINAYGYIVSLFK